MNSLCGNKSLTSLLFLCSLYGTPVQASSHPSKVTMEDVKALEAQLADIKAKLAAQAHDKNTLGKSTPGTKKPINAAFYMTVRPTYGVLEENDVSRWDVRDALSHAGVKVSHEFAQDWMVELHGEWSIDIANDGNFGRSRRAYTALTTPIGRFGIGKQRPTQYLFIAEYADIFNHANSPYAYDVESPFFVDNLVSYKFKMGDVTFIAVGQFEGEEGDNQTDLFNAGFSYDMGGFHAAVTYQENKVFEDEVRQGENEVWAGSLAYQFTDDFYAAVAYQDKSYNRKASSNDRDGSTFDLGLAYKLSKHYKLKTGYFDFDDGYDQNDPMTGSFDGYNVTLEWLPVDKLRVHLEYLDKSFDNNDSFSSWTIGFRYDYKLELP